MAIKKVVTPENLSPSHFKLNDETKQIETILPELPTGNITDLAFDNATKQITYKKDGVVQTVDMTPFLTDIHVEGASLEGNILKLKRADGAGDVTVDLSALDKAIPTTGTATMDVEIQDAFGAPLGFASSTAEVTSTLS